MRIGKYTKFFNRQIQQIGNKAQNTEFDVSVMVKINAILAKLAGLYEQLNLLQSQINGEYSIDGTAVAGGSVNSPLLSVTNNSGVTLDYGDVVIWDTSAADTITTTTTANDLLVAGVVASDKTTPGGVGIAVGAIGNICNVGLCKVNVDADYAAIVAGDYLRTYTTAKQAVKAAAYPEVGVFAMALEAKGSGTGTIDALIFPVMNNYGLARLDGVNQPFTGNVEVEKVNPKIILTDTNDSEYAYISRTDTTCKTVIVNRAISATTSGYAVVGNSNTDRITIPDNVSYAVGTDDFSISMWVYPTNVSALRNVYTDFTTYGYSVQIDTSRNVRLVIIDSHGTLQIITTDTVNLSSWNHILITADRDGNGTIIINNGTPYSVSMATYNGNLNNATNPTFFDAIYGGDGFWGYIDEFALFKKVLDATEKTREWNSGAGYYHTGAETSIYALFHFDENTGTNTYEEIVGQNATLSSVDWISGKVNLTGTYSDVEVLESINGAESGESAINRFNPDDDARGVINGKTVRGEVAGAEQWVTTDGVFRASNDNDVDLGSPTIEWKNLYLDGIAYIDEIQQADNEKHYWGTGNDLSAYHDGTDSKIINTTGELILGTPTTVTIGTGVAGVDYILKFNGESSDGTITWKEDEGYFVFSSLYSSYPATGPVASMGYLPYVEAGFGSISVPPTEAEFVALIGDASGFLEGYSVIVRDVTNSKSYIVSTSDNSKWWYTEILKEASAYHFYHDGSNFYINNDTGEIILDTPITVTIGAGASGVDYILKFNGESNDGTVTWMEDENYFLFGNALVLAAGTTGLPPIKFQSGTLVSSPVAGAVEFSNDKFYLTNVGTQRVIDRTSDVKLTTTTVENTTNETTVYTGVVPANSLRVGNILKLNVSGTVDETDASDVVTIRIKLGGTTIASIDSPGSGLAAACWHITGNATLRSVGGTGSMAWHVDMSVGPDSADDCGVDVVDTTAAENVTVTAQWNNAKAGNIFTCTQGFLEYKN